MIKESLPPVFNFRIDPDDGRLFKALVFGGVVAIYRRNPPPNGGKASSYFDLKTVEQHIASGVWQIIKEEDNETGK